MPVATPMRFVLVRPRRAANVAAACRALKNMGYGRLVLVDPPTDLETRRGLAYGAWDVLDGAERATDLASAVADCTVVAASSGRAGEDALTPRDFAARLDDRAGGGEAAVVFGPEDHGLTIIERKRCHLAVRIPTAPAQPSLNLAQAVLLVAYELFLAGARLPGNAPALATAGEFDGALAALREALLAIGYLNPANPEAVLAELRRLLWQGTPTPRDVVLLRGLARQIAWSARGAESPKEE
jgi:TrmH family RNA methyltransferase